MRVLSDFLMCSIDGLILYLFLRVFIENLFKVKGVENGGREGVWVIGFWI